MRPASLVIVIVIVGFLAIAFLSGRELGRSPERGSRPAAGDRGGPAAVDGAALERLSRSVEALDAAVERLTRRLDEWQERSASRAATANDRIVVDHFEVEAGPGAKPASATTPAPLQDAPDPERRKRFEDIRGMKFEDVNRKHWFWTYEDAVQHYGSPDEIHPHADGRLDFVYRIGDRRALLQFYGGRLLVINWHQ